MGKRGENKRITHIRVLLALIVLLIVSEFSVLITVRRYLPGGIAPARVSDSLPQTLMTHPEFDWVIFDSAELAEIKSRSEAAIPGISSMPVNEKARILRDWVRTVGENESMEIVSKNPCEILDSMESGTGANCYPRAILLTAAMEAWGVPSRRVDFIAEPGNFHTAHSTVEYFDGDRWTIQDPTFNSVPVNDSGVGLAGWEVQELYGSGNEIRWVQNATIIDPLVQEYRIPFSEISNVVFYQLHGYPDSKSKIQLIWIRFLERLQGHDQAVILARDGFPIPNFILDGSIDRALGLVMIFTLIGLVWHLWKS